jgi:TolA-binding protein
MWTRFLVETGEWDGALARWAFDAGEAFDPTLNILFVHTLRAAHAGDAAQAGRHLEEFVRVRAELEQALRTQAETRPTDALYLQRLAVLEQEMRAQLAIAGGDQAAAIEHAREASRLEGKMPYAFGPPFIDWPAAEMLGQLQLRAGEHAAAAEAFATQLERARQRPASLLGLALSQRGLGHAAEADHALEQLRAAWHRADPAAQAALREAATR